MTKTKWTLKTAREKQLITYKGSWIILTADFSSETWKPEGSEITSSSERKITKKENYKMLKKASNQEFYSHQNYPLENRGEIKIIANKQNARELITSRLVLAEKLKKDI